jgi:hypothetical protein
MEGSQVPAKRHAPLTDEEIGYRDKLLELEAQSQDSFDKTLVSLSGGALGVSFAFVDKFLHAKPARSVVALEAAWSFWVLSLALVLSSHFISTLAMRRSVQQIDRREPLQDRMGGRYHSVLLFLNPASGVAFLAGLFCAGYFVAKNL